MSFSVLPGRRFLLLLCGLALSTLGGKCGETGLEWQLTWSDEFEGPAGQSPDAAKWGFDIGDGCPNLCGWGNNQLEYDTNRAENVALDGAGSLRITARAESFQDRDYTSARINTKDTFAQAYGRFEARIKLPKGQGIWPAFWLLGDNVNSVGWPECGEIDILEFRGQETSVAIASLHGPGYSGGSAISGRYNSNVPLSDDFHVYAVEWDNSRITWFLDNTRIQTVTMANLPSGARWVFDHPFFIILNVAVGGNFVGPPNAQTQFPQTMSVDYVRVYELKS